MYILSIMQRLVDGLLILFLKSFLFENIEL